jgi:hypothetical protein
MPHVPPNLDNRNQTLHSITTLIYLLQKLCHAGPIRLDILTCEPWYSVKISQHKHLQALNALATLLVRDSEVVAVTVAQLEPLSLVACFSQHSGKAKLSDSSDADDVDKNIFKLNREFLAAWNPRDLDDTTNSTLARSSLAESLPPGNPFRYLCKVW